ncbi:hypothetical protein MP228_006555 [Amoeboaphelidium protococcarum]|nr:hypothetical protein MP228_006555 [Amoeboaphelidium protococcarum]
MTLLGIKRWLVIVAILIRVLLVAVSGLELWGIRYTDIDYEVFTDAARFMLQEQSPYERSTYRYTPLLALMMTGNHVIDQSFGKLLFVAGDIICGCFMELLLARSGTQSNAVVWWWWLNPFVIAISTRGNAECIIVLLVIITIYLLQNQKLLLAGLIYGVSIHWKIYPLIYAPSIALFIYSRSNTLSASIIKTLKFGVASLLSLGGLTAVFYQRYGMEFLHNAYLYHIGRQDHRHNFSIYNTLMYMQVTAANHITTIRYSSILTFLPQVALLLVISWRYAARDLIMAVFLCTFVFVSFNKVITSQYFIWFLVFIPLIQQRVRMSMKQLTQCTTFWVLSQAVWLHFAYRLEIKGENTFIELFASSIAFFLSNIQIIRAVILSTNE